MKSNSQINIGLNICIGAMILAEFTDKWGTLTLVFLIGWSLLARGLWRKDNE